MGWELPGIRQAEPVQEGLASETPGTEECDVRRLELLGGRGGWSLNVYGCVWAMFGP